MGGGHSSKQIVTATTDSLANAVQTTAQDCINVEYGNNTIAIDGNYNNIQNVSQKLSITLNPTCSTMTASDNSFQTNLSNALSQNMSDQEVAMSQWLDNSKDTQSTNIEQTVSTNITQNTVQKCLNNLTTMNNFYLTGDGNVIKNQVQDSTLNMISQCLLNGQQSTQAISDITNTINQHSTYDSKSPFSFLTDAIEGSIQSIATIAAIIFIVFICFIFLFLMLRDKKPKPSKSTV